MTADSDACIRIRHSFPNEQQYFISLCLWQDKPTVRLAVYALGADMKGSYPFRGDLHIHTCRSDGKEAPPIVCANYRAAGYDFMPITDHRRYYPSLEAIAAFRDVAPSFTIIPGEEVQVPLTDMALVND